MVLQSRPQLVTPIKGYVIESQRAKQITWKESDKSCNYAAYSILDGRGVRETGVRQGRAGVG